MGYLTNCSASDLGDRATWATSAVRRAMAEHSAVPQHGVRLSASAAHDVATPVLL